MNHTDNKNVIIRFGGDLMPGSGVLEKIKEHGPLYPFNKIINEPITHDLFFANLECTLSANNHPPYPDKILLSSKPEIVESFKKIALNIVSLANNHTFDYGVKGFINTKKILDKYAINYTGGGENIDKASEMTLIEKKGIRLAFLSYCSKESGCKHFATETDYGVADIETEAVCRNIQKAKSAADIVIVSLHWGEEFRDYPSPAQIKMARHFVEKGATIIIGHHAHVFQGYEEYSGGLIVYDLGSFIFGDIAQNRYKFSLKKRKHKEGIIVECNVGKKGLTGFRFIPVHINQDFQATFVKNNDGEKILSRFFKQSQKLVSKDYRSFYKKYILKMYFLNHSLRLIRLIRKMLNPRSWHSLYRRTIKKSQQAFTQQPGG